MCLSSHRSTLSCQLYLLPMLTPPCVNASYVMEATLYSTFPQAKGIHLTAPAYQIQPTTETANLRLYGGCLLMHTSPLMYSM